MCVCVCVSIACTASCLDNLLKLIRLVKTSTGRYRLRTLAVQLLGIGRRVRREPFLTEGWTEQLRVEDKSRLVLAQEVTSFGQHQWRLVCFPFGLRLLQAMLLISFSQ